MTVKSSSSPALAQFCNVTQKPAVIFQERFPTNYSNWYLTHCTILLNELDEEQEGLNSSIAIHRSALYYHLHLTLLTVCFPACKLAFYASPTSVGYSEDTENHENADYSPSEQLKNPICISGGKENGTMRVNFPILSNLGGRKIIQLNRFNLASGPWGECYVAIIRTLAKSLAFSETPSRFLSYQYVSFVVRVSKSMALKGS